MADTEEYFPRGGKKPAFKEFKQTNNFLGTFERTEKKKKKPKKKAEGDDGYLSDEVTTEFDVSTKNCAVGLSYQIVKEGLLILGRVSQVLETKVHISLPCRMQGTVMACHISEAYNKILEAYVNDEVASMRELREMFRPGQYVAVKVLEVESANLMLTMMPQHINSGKIHTELQKGTILQAAVSSVEDHGYVMELGIPNTTAFLPKKNINEDIELEAGVLTWCCVKTVTPSSDNTIITLSNELSSLQQTLRRKPDRGITPATPLLFTVDKALENGIEGHIFDGVTCYVQRQHAAKVKGKKPTLGQRVQAHFLYEMPTRKTPFLTLRNIFETTFPNLDEEQKFKAGDFVEEAQVIKISNRSIVFKLGKDSLGVMSLKKVKVDEHLSDEEVIAKSYPIGSSHKVRILRYNLSDYAYSVTDNAQTLSERYFTLSQLQVGQVVEGTVLGPKGLGLSVSVGRLTGYVPATHLSDAGIYIDPKKPNSKPKNKHKVGQQVRARVLLLDETSSSLLLSMKPSLLAADLEVLQGYHQAQPGKAYVGVIKHASAEYVLVTFFNNVTAYVPKDYVTKEAIDIAQVFHKGQIVKCTILKVDPETKKMTGSLTTTPFWPEKKRDPTKRKQKDSDEIPKKKQKQNINESETENKKKKNKTSDSSNETETKDIDKPKKKKDKRQTVEPEKEVKTDDNTKSKKKKSKKIDEQMETEDIDAPKKKKDKQIKNKRDKQRCSSESDAIETDISDDNVLTPQDMYLIDMTDCTTQKNFKKRTISLIKSIEARAKRLEVIEDKIKLIEEKGLDKANKKYHTAMNSEKLVVQERIKLLADALKVAQDKLKAFPEEPKDWKKKNDKKVKEENTEIESKKEKKKMKKEKGKLNDVDESIKEKVKDIKVADVNESVLDLPSVKDFWSDNVKSKQSEVKDDESSSSDEEPEDQPKKKRKKLSVSEKVAKVRAEEERLRALESAAIEGATNPQSVEHFQRALLAAPDSSQLWIAYMAFHLQATEIEKARAVGRKAISSISFREEQEKLNVWLAMINFENRFGTKESLQKTLEEALQMNDTFKVHSKLLDIYTDTSKIQELSSLVDLMLKKYKRDPTMYTQCGAACYKLGLVEKARQVMQKAISLLDKKQHVPVLVQFALLESTHEGRERAEALFEQLVSSYPQRVDVCAVYIDMLLKAGDVERCRQVLERMTSQKMPARKMKVLFKKWIEVEEKIGDQHQIEKIRHRAMEFIENAKF